jgi:hypothetical protein
MTRLLIPFTPLPYDRYRCMSISQLRHPTLTRCIAPCMQPRQAPLSLHHNDTRLGDDTSSRSYCCCCCCCHETARRQNIAIAIALALPPALR